MWETKASDTSEVIFQSRSGPLIASLCSDGDIQLDFPSVAPAELEGDDWTRTAGLLAEVLSIAGATVAPARSDAGEGTYDVLFIGRNSFDYFVHVSASAFAAMVPNLGAISRLVCRGLIVTALGVRAGSCAPTDPRARGHAFVSRFFAPLVGVPEDPVTGSAHCALAPYWAAYLSRHIHERGMLPDGAAIASSAASSSDAGAATLRAFQASRRGGELQVSVAPRIAAISSSRGVSSADGSARGEEDRVLLRGGAVVAYESRLRPAAMPPLPPQKE